VIKNKFLFGVLGLLAVVSILGAPVATFAYTYIPIPSVSTIVSSSTDQVADLAYWVIPLLALVIGLSVAGVLALVFKRGIMGAVRKVAGGGRRGRGRRRR